jgi:hypothetical protein
MTSHASNVPDSALDSAPHARAPSPGDDALAAELRVFGPLGIVAILAILFTGNVIVGPMVVARRIRSYRARDHLLRR